MATPMEIARSFLDERGVPAAVDHVLELAGGYSGAEVFLAWINGMPPVVMKRGQATYIEAEHEGRKSQYSREPDLEALRLDHLGEIHSEDGLQLRCMAYMFDGGANYGEMRRRMDFDAYLNNFIDPGIPIESLSECLRQVTERVWRTPQEESRSSPLPLSEYLPTISWPGTTNTLEIVGGLLPMAPGLKDFQAWFETHSSLVRIAPVHDRRPIHGDLWSGNVLVDTVKSDVYVIDYGNSRLAHGFQDLARFEIDIILRAGSTRPQVTPELRVVAMRNAAMSLLPAPSEPMDALIPLRYWRDVTAEATPTLAAPGGFEMYRWFLLAELLKRIRWVTPSANAIDADGGTLLQCILTVQSAIDPDRKEAPSVRAPGQLQQQLGLIDVYLPVRGQERRVNHTRNARKANALRRSAGPKGLVKLLAETGHSYLNQRGVFADDVRALLDGGGHIQVTHLARDFALTRIQNNPLDSHSNVEDFQRKHDEAVEGYQILREEYPYQVVLKHIGRELAATILATSQSLFYEPYLASESSKRTRVLFDTFEFELSSADQNHLTGLLQDHLDYIHSQAESYE